MCYHNGSTSFGWGDYMKKAKKYIYPFVFSICFYVLFAILGLVIKNFYDNYGGLGLILLFIILWILVAAPIFCFKYSKLIYKEKRKSLFILYNSLVVTLCHTGPLLISGDNAFIIIQITIALFGWIAFCTYVSYTVRIEDTKERSENDASETGE